MLKASRISHLFAFIQTQWAVKIPNVPILRQYKWDTLYSKTGNFLLSREKNEKWVIFDAIGYHGLPEYEINLPLLKVNEPWKFQTSSSHISIGQTQCKTGHTIQQRSFKRLGRHKNAYILW